MTRTTRVMAVGALAVWVICASAPRVLAIGPSVMMFYGTTLKSPVLITGADVDLFPDTLKAFSVPAADLEGRTFVPVAMFWGPLSNPAGNGISDLTKLKPEMAWQHGRLFPAAANRPAIFLVTTFAKGQASPAPADAKVYGNGGVVSAAAVELLKRRGVIGGSKTGLFDLRELPR